MEQLIGPLIKGELVLSFSSFSLPGSLFHYPQPPSLVMMTSHREAEFFMGMTS